jgi:phosphoserine phosphatase RsbU/P
VGLGLAKHASFVPAGADVSPAGVRIPVYRPVDRAFAGRREVGATPALNSGLEGVLEGHLVCDGANGDTIGDLHYLVAHAGAALAGTDLIDEIERREDAVRRIAERLQDGLLPDLPHVQNTALAVRYRAAGREARVGGDFYDVFHLPDQRVLIVVGDVMGKGVEAAGRTSRVTQTIRALALQDLMLDSLMERLDEQVAYQDPELMATVWCGIYEPQDGELVFCSLGHPPALLLRADGEPISLTLEGLPLGMRTLADRQPELRSRRLGHRDILALYTDGVVEASGDFGTGQEALVAALRARRDEPLEEAISGALEELLAGSGHTDDAVMLLLRRL